MEISHGRKLSFIKGKLKKIQNDNQTMMRVLIVSMILSQLLVVVLAKYIPNYAYSASRYNPQTDESDPDSEGDYPDDMDSKASENPYNQDSSQAGASNDGYDDNEPDGPYEETPREEEGQADLERFFDDHLGASEREGMDKENLPTNLMLTIVKGPEKLFNNELNSNDSLIEYNRVSPMSRNNASLIESDKQQASAASENTEQQTLMPNNLNHSGNAIVTRTTNSYPDQPEILPKNIETRYIQLPNRKLIITRQITRGPVYKGGLDMPNFPNLHNDQLVQTFNNQQELPNYRSPNHHSTDNLAAIGSNDVISTEDDDMDRVYVTRATNKPFRIDALNGYDPEEDFQNASRDLEYEPKRKSRMSNRDDERSTNQSNEDESQPIKDITFDDPEADTLFNDASETDEVTFSAQEDPYQTDLEAEMRDQHYDRPGQVTAPSRSSKMADDEQEAEDSRERTTTTTKRKGNTDDESEGSWVNDGVEDMDIPSQEHQDRVLAKAAKQEALARRAAEDEALAEADNTDAEGEGEYEGDRQQPSVNDDPDSQRMLTTDYLKNDLVMPESDDEALAAAK